MNKQTNNQFYVGQVFEGVYPPEAAMWCNDNQKVIVEREGKYVIEEIPAPPIEQVRQWKKDQLNAELNNWRLKHGTLISSVGFEIDCDQKAKNDVDDLLLTSSKDSPISFRDAHNEFHQITLEQLKTIQLEIAQANLQLNQQKWALDQAIEQATTSEQIQAIEITIEKADYSLVK